MGRIRLVEEIAAACCIVRVWALGATVLSVCDEDCTAYLCRASDRWWPFVLRSTHEGSEKNFPRKVICPGGWDDTCDGVSGYSLTRLLDLYCGFYWLPGVQSHILQM